MKEYIIGNKINLRKIELKDKESIKNILDLNIDQILNSDGYCYLITLKDDTIIGYITLSNQNTIFIIKEYQTIEIGSNVLRLILSFAFNDLKKDSISCIVDESNNYLNELFKLFHFTNELNDNGVIYKLNKQDYKTKVIKKNKYLTGEDIDMFNERSSTQHKNICDNHWDGA